MTVVKRVCEDSMHTAQEEIKNSPGYFANGEVAIYFCSTVAIFLVSCLIACGRRGHRLT